MILKYQKGMVVGGLPLAQHVEPQNRSGHVPNFQQYECEKFPLIGKCGIS